MSNAESLPVRLGHYRIDACLGRGETGLAYRAYEESLDRAVVLKVLLADLATRPDCAERFHAEARAAAAVDHPNVARIYWVSADAAPPFFAREHIEGESLRERLRVSGRLNPKEARRILELALEGLAAVHGQGLLHSNLKPANIIIESSSGRVVLTDLGLGWNPEGRETADSAARPYQAPEQCLGHPLDSRSDFYALGAILLESLLGHPPASTEELLLPVGMDRSVARVLDKLLAVDRGRRYPDAATALAALRSQRAAGRADRKFSPARIPAGRGRLLVGLCLGFAAIVFLILSGLGLVVWYWASKSSVPPTPLATTVPLEETHAEEVKGNKHVEGNPMADAIPLADREERRPDVVSPPQHRSPRPLPPESVPLTKLAPTVTNSIKMRLARIPSGRFLMGSHESLEALDRDFDHPYGDFTDERPQHPVFLSKHFYMGIYEVTQAEFETVMGVNPSRYSAHGLGSKEVAGLDTHRFPVEGVTWFDAVEFCRRLSEMPVERAHGRVYRLPTEAEWEYACRGGRSPTRYYFGSRNSQVSRHGWLGPNGRTHQVGQLIPNAFGLYDMIGNAPEWCQDVYRPTYYRERTAVDPQGPAPTSPDAFRVLRAGPRSSQRHRQEPARAAGAGFRIVFTYPYPKSRLGRDAR